MRIRIGMIFSLILILVVSWQCQDLAGTLDSPYDPSSAGYIAPETEILSGPGNGSTVHTDSVVYIWHHPNTVFSAGTMSGWVDAGRLLFAFRINHTVWSPWQSGKAVLQSDDPYWSFDTTTGYHKLILNNLEDGSTEIEIRCMYPTNIEEENWPDRTFTVQSQSEPAIILSPSNVYIDSSNALVLNAQLEGVTNAYEIQCNLKYDPEFVELTSYEFYSDSSNFTTDLSPDSLITFSTVNSLPDTGWVTCRTNLFDITNTGVSGSGVWLRMIFTHIGAKGYSTISVMPESDLLNSDSLSVLQETRNSHLTVW